MKPLRYYAASSLDGFIAQEDGSFDAFLWDDALVADFFASFEEFDTVLIGRKTYEVGLAEGKTSPYPTMRQFVFSRSMERSPDEAVTLVSEGAVDLVRDLKAGEGKTIWLCGGGNLASQLLAAGLIDELVVKLNPIVLGTGVPLFGEVREPPKLELRETKTYDSGILQLSYRISS